MTAVEWLIEQIIKYELVPKGTHPDNVLFNKAKAMEKEQIMKAVKDSWYMAKGSNFQYPQEEQYYNETYNK